MPTDLRATPSAPVERSWLRGTGLDTSNGAGFIQERIALSAKLLGIIAFAFLIVGLAAGAALGFPDATKPTLATQIAHTSGLIVLGGIWLLCRRKRQLSLRVLHLLDALALVGACTAWSFFIDTRFLESPSTVVISAAMTMLGRAIAVPSKAGRTLRLCLLSAVPILVSMGFWVHALVRERGLVLVPYSPWVTAMYQTLLLAAVISMATVTSRILYDLRRSAREANELGQYTLEERLGAGGMGEVWRARHRFLVRAAAIKLIRPELLERAAADPQVVLRRFEREAMATAALRSPHTVQLYDFGQAEDGTLFYVMELLTGIDLEELVRRFGPVPAERAVHILKQVCHSLEEAHQNGLTHRDIKPANIVVSGTGTELDFVKVLDFGLVRFQPEQARGNAKLTAEGSVTGTPAYTAPEVAMGEAGYDHRVDLYAVGCVAYWLLTGTLVFDGTNVMKMIVDHARTAPTRPQERTELPIPAELEQIVMDCLAKDPAARPASAAILADRLDAVKLDKQWTRERAAGWWRVHAPAQQVARPVADVLLSREDRPAGARELRPRRAPLGVRKDSLE